MKITWNWLAEFVDLELTLEEIAERLTMGGIEVEGTEAVGAELAPILCAEVAEVSTHPQAERLRICQIHLGGAQAVQVVCGAPNVEVGQRVAYAPPGTVLPGGKRIEAAEIRGVASAGMLCSAVELGLGDDASGLLLLPSDSRLGARLAELLAIEDTVIEVSITPNRGDCLSVLGIAREIVALTGQRLRPGSLAICESGPPIATLVDIRIADPDLCSRYVGRVITDVQIGPSPQTIQNRLRAVGMRPINNVVDVTNYVMLERGQPLHAFDYDRLPAPEITVRRARPRERLRTLDGQDRELDPSDLLITSADVPVAIAGVMGGENTEVTASTSRILLESAWFAPASVRQTSKRLGLRSEASYRFERVTDVAGVPLAADRAAQLIATTAGGAVAHGHCDVYARPLRAGAIRLRLQRIEDLLGVQLAADAVIDRLRAFGMEVSNGGGGTLAVLAPSYRSDLTREIDLVEEVARSVGYENLPATLPECGLDGAGEPPRRVKQRALTALLNGLGLDELVMLSFCSVEENASFSGLQSEAGAVDVVNPITQEHSQLRRSLCGGLVATVRHNLAQGTNAFAGFSIGKVFWPWGDAYDEGLRLSGVVCRRLPAQGLGARAGVLEFDDVKGLVDGVLEQFRLAGDWQIEDSAAAFHPGQTARILHAGKRIGVVGRLHPRAAEEHGIEAPCWLFELDLETLLNYEPPPITFKELSRFPAVVRDLAVVVDDAFEAQEVIRFVQEFAPAGGLFERIELFDSYRGDPIPPGKRSLAYSISYRASDRTLTDDEVNELHQKLIKALEDSLAIERR